MKLAILIEGPQNSGKTSSIRKFINIFCDKSNRQMRIGWQRVSLNQSFPNLKMDTYCIPSSPSETNVTLSARFKNWNHIPDILILAVQPNGQHHNNSYNYLRTNNYHILSFTISNVKGVGDWERFDQNTKQNKLTKRANDINKEIRHFIKNFNII